MKANIKRPAITLLKTCLSDRRIRELAHSRLQKKCNNSNISVTILSVSVVSFGIFLFLFDGSLPGYYSRIINALTMIASIMVIVITLHENGRKYDVRATRMLIAAKSLDVLYHQLSRAFLSDDLTDSQIEHMWRTYKDIQAEAQEMNEPVDEHYYEAFEQHKTKFTLLDDCFVDTKIDSVGVGGKARALFFRSASIYSSFICFVIFPFAISATAISTGYYLTIQIGGLFTHQA